MVSKNFFDTPQRSEDITGQLANIGLLTEFLQRRQCDGVGLVRATQPGQSFRLKPEYRRPASGSFFRRKRGDEALGITDPHTGLIRIGHHDLLSTLNKVSEGGAIRLLTRLWLSLGCRHNKTCPNEACQYPPDPLPTHHPYPLEGTAL